MSAFCLRGDCKKTTPPVGGFSPIAATPVDVSGDRIKLATDRAYVSMIYVV